MLSSNETGLATPTRGIDGAPKAIAWMIQVAAEPPV